MNAESYDGSSEVETEVEKDVEDSKMDWFYCKVCGNREPDNDDILIHVNDHSISEQLNVLVEGDSREGLWDTPVTEELFESEYSARTTVMRDVPRMKRLEALITPCYSPVEELNQVTNQMTYRGP